MELDEGYYSSPRWTYEILDCSMPMTFDTYSNCAHQCAYCFSFFQRAVGTSADDYLHHRVRSVDVERVKRMFTDPDKYAGQFAWYIKRKMVLQWGGLSDGFDWYEKKFGKSLELLKFFVNMDYPISISTKGVWFVDDPEYRAVLKDAKNVHFKYSIITTNERHAQKLEMGTPSPMKRFEALYKLKELGIGATTTRFRPFVPGVSDIDVENIFRESHNAGVYSLTTEWLCLESRASVTAKQRYDLMGEVAGETFGKGFDMLQYYYDNSSHKSGLLRLNYDLKRPMITKMQELADKYGIQFFVSDAHHKESSHSAGCCGLPDTGPLSNINRGQFAEAILIAKRNSKVHWSDIAVYAEDLKNIPFYQAEGFNLGTTRNRANNMYKTMFDYMHNIWNDPKSWMSPARYFGGALVPAGRDDENNIIYLYNKPFVEDGARVQSVAELAVKLGMSGKAKADKYDAMTADGTEWGHVAYPVFILSRGRAHNSTTMRLLSNMKVNYQIVVNPDEATRYAEEWIGADILQLPSGNLSLGASRQWILDYCRNEGISGYWLLDDDITQFYQSGKPVGIRSALSTAERFIDQYDNIASLGISYEGEQQGQPFSVNVNNSVCVWINSTVKDYNYGLKSQALSDLSLTLSILDTKRYCTVRLNEFTLGTSERLGGGLSWWQIKNITEEETLIDADKYHQPLIPSGLMDGGSNVQPLSNELVVIQ